MSNEYKEKPLSHIRRAIADTKRKEKEPMEPMGYAPDTDHLAPHKNLTDSVGRLAKKIKKLFK